MRNFENASKWDILIAKIREKAHSPGKATTSGPQSDSAYDPISIEAYETEEQRLGFHFPSLIRRLYTEVGNGGFGPGHGLLTMVPLSQVDRPIPLYYSSLRSRRKDWNAGVIPFNDWGCLIVSCLDISSPLPDPPVLRFEPNMNHEDTISFLGDKPFRGIGVIPESDTLSGWFEDWIDGKEMFQRPYEANA